MTSRMISMHLNGIKIIMQKYCDDLKKKKKNWQGMLSTCKMQTSTFYFFWEPEREINKMKNK